VTVSVTVQRKTPVSTFAGFATAPLRVNTAPLLCGVVIVALEPLTNDHAKLYEPEPPEAVASASAVDAEHEPAVVRLQLPLTLAGSETESAE
jgi:hypothetical protein